MDITVEWTWTGNTHAASNHTGWGYQPEVTDISVWRPLGFRLAPGQCCLQKCRGLGVLVSTTGRKNVMSNKLSLKKPRRLKALIPADNEEMNFLYENNLPKGLQSKRSASQASQASQPSHDSPLSKKLFLTTGLCEGLWLKTRIK